MIAMIALGLFLFLVVLGLNLMYSPPSAWIGRDKKGS
jgi:hypothetical protein